ncbi:MAG: adenosylcobinamide-GDP ribazoletransferase [Candidatus Omnitrophota bacterium]|jgi:adenosylcobinamide-GDP ribazoletransferase
MTHLFFALQFLTIIPVKIKTLTQETASRSLVYFPLVGLLLGAALCFMHTLCRFIGLPPLSIDIILVITLAILTAAMHLDGLADTADGLLSGKSKEGSLAIMKDPHIGVMGVVSITSALSLKFAFLYALAPAAKPTALLLMCLLGRWALVWNLFLFPYARKDGKAKSFFEGINAGIVTKAALVTIVCALCIGRLQGLLLFLIITIFTYFLGRSLSRKIEGMTGDTLGAINEISEIICLLWICIL